jgi:hypothetical protein
MAGGMAGEADGVGPNSRASDEDDADVSDGAGAASTTGGGGIAGGGGITACGSSGDTGGIAGKGFSKGFSW